MAAHPPALLAIVGVAVILRDLRRPVTDPALGFALICALRSTILGLALAAVAAAWVWQLRPLGGLALVILTEEMLEASVVIAVLRSPPRLSAGGLRAAPRR